MPDLDDVLAAHVAWLRLLRRSERTIYERQRAVIRLAAWLGGGPAGPRSKRISLLLSADPGAPQRQVSLLAATSADLAAWRASLTVGDRALLTYCCHIREL